MKVWEAATATPRRWSFPSIDYSQESLLRGRVVETFFVQSNADRRTTELCVYPSHLLTVKEHESWTED
jgi:hypothetical protein